MAACMPTLQQQLFCTSIFSASKFSTDSQCIGKKEDFYNTSTTWLVVQEFKHDINIIIIRENIWSIPVHCSRAKMLKCWNLLTTSNKTFSCMILFNISTLSIYLWFWNNHFFSGWATFTWPLWKQCTTVKS